MKEINQMKNIKPIIFEQKIDERSTKIYKLLNNGK